MAGEDVCTEDCVTSKTGHLAVLESCRTRFLQLCLGFPMLFRQAAGNSESAGAIGNGAVCFGADDAVALAQDIFGWDESSTCAL